MAKLKVASKDIFPLIKKFLYNDQDIFLRELVSNAVDATQKLNTLFNKGEYTGTITNQVKVYFDKDNNTLTISDNGIGMTEAEVERYICQIAFSGATDFIEKYADADIIGHFGMGFYSSFMVADKVEINTWSYQNKTENGYTCVHWSCDGNVNYKLESVDNVRDYCGTDIILHISESYKEYFTEKHIKELLNKYNKFIKVPVIFVEVLHEYVDSSTNETVTPENKETRITSDNALWMRNPSDLTDEDYLKFYKEMYPNKPDPVFWLHLNIDHPFNFKGILYFPAYDVKKPLYEKCNLHFYCNQVFVTNNLEGVLPEYLRLLHGIIDSPDIPLNMSRSDLQADSNVKKIRSYISTKVVAALKKIMKNDRETYEKKWDTIKTFINLGVIMEEDVYDKARDIILLTDIDGKHYTFEEYYNAYKDNQTDKNGKVIYLYTYDTTAQYSYIEEVKELGYNILLMDTHYSSFEVHSFEIEMNKNKKDDEPTIEFKRIDAEPANVLINKDTADEKQSEAFDDVVKSMIISLFNACAPVIPKYKFKFMLQHLGADKDPIVMTNDEFFRRMKEMQTLNNEGYYVAVDTTLNVILNEDSPVMKTILNNAKDAIGDKITDVNNRGKELSEKYKPAEGEQLSEDLQKEAREVFTKLNNEKNDIIKEYAQTDNHINELIDIALLEYGLLNGESLHKFIKRSFKMIFG